MPIIWVTTQQLKFVKVALQALERKAKMVGMALAMGDQCPLRPTPQLVTSRMYLVRTSQMETVFWSLTDCHAQMVCQCQIGLVEPCQRMLLMVVVYISLKDHCHQIIHCCTRRFSFGGVNGSCHISIPWQVVATAYAGVRKQIQGVTLQMRERLQVLRLDYLAQEGFRQCFQCRLPV